MPANTPNRGYTYATSDDANDLALISQRLAEQIDSDVQNVVNRGRAVLATPLTTSTTAASAETLTPLTVTFTAEAGVTYEIKLTTRIQGSSTDLRAGARIRRGNSLSGTLIGEVLQPSSVAAVGITTEYTVFDTPGAGSVTYVVSTATLGGTGNTNLAAAATSPSTLVVRAC